VEIQVFLDRARKSLIIALEGELDFATVHALGRTLIVVGTFQIRHVIINARMLSFCDCAGLSALLAAQQMVRRAGGELCIVHAQPLVQRLFEITGHGCSFTSPTPCEHPV
jgi:anti-anti-sigma factor